MRQFFGFAEKAEKRCDGAGRRNGHQISAAPTCLDYTAAIQLQFLIPASIGEPHWRDQSTCAPRLQPKRIHRARRSSGQQHRTLPRRPTGNSRVAQARRCAIEDKARRDATARPGPAPYLQQGAHVVAEPHRYGDVCQNRRSRPGRNNPPCSSTISVSDSDRAEAASLVFSSGTGPRYPPPGRRCRSRGRTPWNPFRPCLGG